jgi:peptidoglycan/xylan/chitin deacetylase (PgdA/CDA1 family)
MVWVFLVAAGIIALAHTAPAPFLLEAFNPSRSIWHVEPEPGEPPAIYLTFDDGPNPAWTPPLLDALREAGAHATFFLIDAHVHEATAPIVRRIADDGHAIGLHSGTRRLMSLEPDVLAETLRNAAARIAAITGREPCRLFRPHAGWRSGEMYEGLERAGYRLAGWSGGMWDFDWGRKRDGDKLARRLARKASAGDVIVIHDGHHKNPDEDRRHAADAVRRLVPELKTRGYRFGTLCQPDRIVNAVTP